MASNPKRTKLLLTSSIVVIIACSIIIVKNNWLNFGAFTGINSIINQPTVSYTDSAGVKRFASVIPFYSTIDETAVVTTATIPTGTSQGTTTGNTGSATLSSQPVAGSSSESAPTSGASSDSGITSSSSGAGALVPTDQTKKIKSYKLVQLYDYSSDLAGAMKFSGIATGINNNNEITGYVTGSAGGRYIPFKWSQTDGFKLLTPDKTSGTNMPKYAISGNGTVVGTINSYPWHAAAWIGGSLTDLGTLAGETTSSLRSINNNGTAVGYSLKTDLTGVIWDSTNGLKKLNLPWNCSPQTINDKGQIAGGPGYDFKAPSAWFYDPSDTSSAGGVTAIAWDNSIRAGMGTITGMNNSGQVVGWGQGYNGAGSLTTKGLIWDKTNGLKQIGTDEKFAPQGINNQGQVVGMMSPFGGGAFVWDATNGLIQLQGLDSSLASSAYAINDNGYVVGSSLMYTNGKITAGGPVMWAPQYE